MPRGFQFPNQNVQLWKPVDFSAGWGVRSRSTFYLYVIGRLKPGTPLAQANAELESVSRRLAQAYPENRGASAFAVPLQQDLANMAGTSRETISRMIHAFIREGHLEIERGKLIINDYEKFKTRYL